MICLSDSHRDLQVLVRVGALSAFVAAAQHTLAIWYALHVVWVHLVPHCRLVRHDRRQHSWSEAASQRAVSTECPGAVAACVTAGKATAMQLCRMPLCGCAAFIAPQNAAEAECTLHGRAGSTGAPARAVT